MTEKDGPPPGGPDLRSYGRRHGRRLSPRQERLLAETLPRLALDLSRPLPAPPGLLFGRPCEVWLEIGFGSGEHLVAQALARPDVGLIGCEPFINGVVKVLSAVDERRLGNIRLHAGDARAVIRRLPPASLARVVILFPDPWPKRRHQKRRLMSIEFINELAQIMAPGAELRFATDIGEYARMVLANIRARGDAFLWLAEGPADWRIRPDDWPATAYERKALAAGRRCFYLRFRRR